MTNTASEERSHKEAHFGSADGNIHQKIGHLEARQDATETRIERFEKYMMRAVDDMSSKLDSLIKSDTDRNAEMKASWRVLTTIGAILVFCVGLVTWGLSEYMRYTMDAGANGQQEQIVEEVIDRLENRSDSQ